MTTIGKVAQRAGVSQTTVSHALNHADRVSPEIRERVLKAVEELGYRPNPQAQSLRTGKTNIVALMVPDICNPYYPEIVLSIQTALGEVGLDALVYNTDVPGGRGANHAADYLRQARRKRVDGVIIADAALFGLHAELNDLGLTGVFIGGLDNGTMDSVGVDNFQAAYRMGRYLIEKGHRRIAHVTGPSHFSFARERKAGFEKALADAGAPIDSSLVYEGSFLSPSGHDAANWLVEEHGSNLPTAAFAASPLMAIGLLAQLYDLKVQVPRDISVAAYDRLSLLDDIRPRLTTVGCVPAALGRAAVTMLRDRLEGRFDGPPRREVIPFELIERESA